MTTLFGRLTELPLPLFAVSLFVYSLLRDVLIIAVFYLLYRTAIGMRRKRTSGTPPLTLLKAETKTFTKIIALDSILFATFVKFGLLQASVDSKFSAVVLTFIALFFWFEAWFYGLHRLLHTRLLFPIHRTHHRSIVPGPFSAFSFSVVERILLFSGTASLILLAGALGYRPSLSGIALYFNFNVFMSVLGHSDLRIFPEWMSRNRVLGQLSDPTEHSLHHARYGVNYGLFLNSFDRLFRTFAPSLPTQEVRK